MQINAGCAAQADDVGMGETQERELRDTIAHYRSLRRMTLDVRALKALDNLIAEAEAQLRRLDCPGKVRAPA